MSDPMEAPVKQWQLANAESRIGTLESQQEKEDKSRSWFQRAVLVSILTFVVQLAILAIGVYVFRRQ